MTKGCVHNAVFFALISLGTTNKSVFLDIIWAEMVKNVQHVQLTSKLWVIEHKIISIHNYISLCVRSSIIKLGFCIYSWFQILLILLNFSDIIKGCMILTRLHHHWRQTPLLLPEVQQHLEVPGLSSSCQAGLHKKKIIASSYEQIYSFQYVHKIFNQLSWIKRAGRYMSYSKQK